MFVCTRVTFRLQWIPRPDGKARLYVPLSSKVDTRTTSRTAFLDAISNVVDHVFRPYTLKIKDCDWISTYKGELVSLNDAAMILQSQSFKPLLPPSPPKTAFSSQAMLVSCFTLLTARLLTLCRAYTLCKDGPGGQRSYER